MTSENHREIAEVTKAQNPFLNRLAKAVVAELVAKESPQPTMPDQSAASKPVERLDRTSVPYGAAQYRELK
jgi:hypothetical protein